MANRLKMEKIEAIKALVQRGWSERRISRELGVHRATVRQYSRCEDGSMCTIPRTGKEEGDRANCTIPRTGKSGRQSKCALYRESIEEKLRAGLSAERIHQDLVLEAGFEGSYDSVQRFVKQLKVREPRRVWRMEVDPGEEAQVDYGTMHILDEGGCRLKQVHVHLLRVILSHSRKGYTEAVRQQTTESFIRSLENAFRHFGGTPASLCIDNLRAAVTKADWYEPEIHPKIRSFAEHTNRGFPGFLYDSIPPALTDSPGQTIPGGGQCRRARQIFRAVPLRPCPCPSATTTAFSREPNSACNSSHDNLRSASVPGWSRSPVRESANERGAISSSTLAGCFVEGVSARCFNRVVNPVGLVKERQRRRCPAPTPTAATSKPEPGTSRASKGVNPQGTVLAGPLNQET